MKISCENARRHHFPGFPIWRRVCVAEIDGNFFSSSISFSQYHNLIYFLKNLEWRWIDKIFYIKRARIVFFIPRTIRFYFNVTWEIELCVWRCISFFKVSVSQESWKFLNCNWHTTLPYPTEIFLSQIFSCFLHSQVQRNQWRIFSNFSRFSDFFRKILQNQKDHVAYDGYCAGFYSVTFCSPAICAGF